MATDFFYLDRIRISNSRESFAARLGRYIAAEHITAINKLGEYAWPDWQSTCEKRFGPTISRKTA
jgi:hypothetical protein